MTDFSRAPQDMTQPPKPLTWDYAVRFDHSMFANDLVLSTCRFGHTCRLVSTVHRIADDGTVSPSYVCPVPGCTFHEWARLVGWDPTLTPALTPRANPQ